MKKTLHSRKMSDSACRVDHSQSQHVTTAQRQFYMSCPLQRTEEFKLFAGVQKPYSEIHPTSSRLQPWGFIQPGSRCDRLQAPFLEPWQGCCVLRARTVEDESLFAKHTNGPSKTTRQMEYPWNTPKKTTWTPTKKQVLGKLLGSCGLSRKYAGPMKDCGLNGNHTQ